MKQFHWFLWLSCLVKCLFPIGRFKVCVWVPPHAISSSLLLIELYGAPGTLARIFTAFYLWTDERVRIILPPLRVFTHTLTPRTWRSLTGPQDRAQQPSTNNKRVENISSNPIRIWSHGVEIHLFAKIIFNPTYRWRPRALCSGYSPCIYRRPTFESKSHPTIRQFRDRDYSFECAQR